jgi:hypothetical protein
MTYQHLCGKPVKYRRILNMISNLQADISTHVPVELSTILVVDFDGCTHEFEGSD